ncbi:MAG: hypothetical protein A3F54_00585 [Candidatus Kerfeldbacteria bacterium RIFCSPHIGHO2_12_FULL_48_17]|uniref:Clp R domain-containing protein n=1 Tax=Candidatus Kerfeldbacteria bacterium RIFCSPHIGHO2_12_FULL_48_17 TaxID=1798542 RepID=A0A1G2B838_9BACT|nr:MAG: hypothetical protein A3F54_00585 [Candidatus Kerfeldbacteria bacterium RIFCSPHIGHO2_12_FULL_48_17]
MQSDILQKFTTHLKNSLAYAVNTAIEYNMKTVTVDFLLLGLLHQRGSIGGEILLKAGLQPQQVKHDIDDKHAKSKTSKRGKNQELVLPEFSDLARKIIEKAALLAAKYQHQYIGTEHLLTSILETDKEKITNYLKKFSIVASDIEQQLQLVLKSASKFPDITANFTDDMPGENMDAVQSGGGMSSIGSATGESRDMGKGHQHGGGGAAANPSALDFFATHLTDAELQKDIDPVIGRSQEIERLIHILSRRTKNNPILIGEPGVGKTAIIEGLAKRILESKVPDALLDKKIYSLDMGLVIAGTIYRGEFEGRFKQIIDEVRSDPDIVLFIDEIHTLVGAGGTGSGALDAANILKPALSKGHIRCIGATTTTEYQKHIESDSALERRFQSILVEEQPEEEVVEVLKGLRKNYEQFHNVDISDEAIDAAVNLSARYIQDKFLPDKAIDLLDEAASRVRISRKSDNITQTIRGLEKQLLSLTGTKTTAVTTENFDEALHLKNKEFALRKRITEFKNLKARAPKRRYGVIKAKDIALIISRMTKIPLQELLASEKKKLLNLEQQLAQKVVGQVEAVNTVASFVRRSRAGLVHPDRPIASFIFMGPTGVGKTELAKVLAEEVFDDPHALLRIDMSEFSEGFNISKLIGAPAGYVGYKDGAKLTDSVRRKPYSVVLFDEIEKAHPDVFNLLLQVLEDGHITDATGRRINFKNTIIIMTSNIGLNKFASGQSLGFGSKDSATAAVDPKEFDQMRESALAELHNTFRPEFLNRIDKVVVFRPLTLEDIVKITRIHVKDVAERLEEKELQLEISPSTIRFIAAQSFKPEQGARAVRRMILELIENPLADMLLEDRFSAGDTVKVKLKNKQLVFTKSESDALIKRSIGSKEPAVAV